MSARAPASVSSTAAAPSAWRRHLWLPYLGVSLLLAAVAAVGLGPAGVYQAVALGSVAAVLTGRALWRPADGRPWVLAAVGLGCWAAADLVWAVLDAAGGAPFPSVADGLYVLGYGFLLAAAHGVVAGERHDRDALWDSAIVCAGAAALISMNLVDAASDTAGSMLAKATAIAYPALSLLLVGAGARLWLSFRSRRPTIALLCGAYVLQLAADSVYAVQSVSGTYVGGVVDFGWLAAYTLLGASALHPSVVEPPRRRRVERSALTAKRLVLLAAAALGPLAGHALFGLPVSFAMAGTALLAAVCVARVAGPVEAMRRAATTDDLTGLRNRAAALDVIDDLLASGKPVAVLCCDVDRVKLVTDALGHAAGDALICTASQRLRATVPVDCTVARSGHELVVVVPDGSSARARHIAEELQTAMLPSVAVGEVQTSTTVSIGVAVSGVSEEGGDVLRRAHAALARAKSAGGDQISSADSGEEDAYWRLRLAADLRVGLQRGEITVAFQPEVDLRDGGLFGFEVLARWTHPTLGPVQPSVFIPVAEESGLVCEVSAVVLEAALATQHLWKETLGETVAVAVNVSATQLGDALVDHVRTAIARWQPAQGSLWLELTESTVADTPQALDVLCRLRALGVRLAIDDFGTGHSSIARLASIDWDAIKIDCSFVRDMLVDDRARTVTEATIAMAKALGVLTVAEGVETAAQRDELVRLGCDVVQGYLIARPLDQRAATDVVRSMAAQRHVALEVGV